MDINQKIMEMYNNEDLFNIMSSAAKGFINQLSSEELKGCKLEAIWDAIRFHDPEKGMRLSSFLYVGVYYKCLTLVKLQKKTAKLTTDIGYFNRETEKIDIEDEMGALPNSDIIQDKLDGFKNSEISRKRGLKPRQVYQKINETRRIMKQRLSESV